MVRSSPTWELLSDGRVLSAMCKLGKSACSLAFSEVARWVSRVFAFGHFLPREVFQITRLKQTHAFDLS